MPAALQNEVKEIFHESLRREPGESRDNYLTDACSGNKELRAEVESLLKSLEEARSFLEVPLTAESEIDHGATSLSAGCTISHYRIESLLGSGGMGEVYLATDRILRRPVALKIIPDSLSPDSERVRRFEREAQAIAELNHPNIMTIFEFGTSNDKHFIVSEYIKGVTVRQRLAGGPLPIMDVLDIAIQTAAALQAAHSACIIHRDIKPENIMIRDDGYVKVLDFGLAKLTALPEREFNAQFSVTSQPGMMLGTSSYVSPEQARGREVDPRTDLFSLGVVIYEMLTGVQPFKGDTAIDVVAEIIQGDPPPLETDDSKIPKGLCSIIKRLLEKKPKRRFPDAATLHSELVELRDRIKGEPFWVRTLSEAELDILERPTTELPTPGYFQQPYSLYFLLFALILAVVTALLVYSRMG